MNLNYFMIPQMAPAADIAAVIGYPEIAAGPIPISDNAIRKYGLRYKRRTVIGTMERDKNKPNRTSVSKEVVPGKKSTGK